MQALRIASAIVMLALLMSVRPGHAQSGGGEAPVAIDNASAEIAAIHASMVERAAALGLPLIRSDSSAVPRAVGQLQYPLLSKPADLGVSSTGISNHVDLDATTGIRDFACGSRTYDGHKGTDIFLWPFPWTSMDRKEVSVVAAFGGTILDKQDGQNDRQCQWGGNPPANYVVIRHDNGLLGYYWHLKTASVTTKAVGARVVTGEYLGFVGSSGFSTGPHLHFEIRGADQRAIEPAAGACDPGPTSWTHQAAPIDTTIVDLLTHSAPPSFSQCFDPAPNIKNHFARGNQLYAAVYLRDQPAGRSAQLQILDPAGVVRFSGTTGSPSSGFYKASYWWFSYVVPANAPAGTWRLRSTIGTASAERAFTVTTPAAATSIGMTIASPTRTIAPGATATFNVTVRNLSARAAIGCRLSLDRPIRADVSALGPGSTQANKVFTVAASGQSVVRLLVKARAGFEARSAKFPVKASCTNAGSAISLAATGTLVLSSPP